MSLTTDYRDGFWCIRDEDNDHSEPFRIVYYWPVMSVARLYVADLIGLPVDRLGGSNGGAYSIRLSNQHSGPRRDVRLINGGQTKAVAFEKIPIPCPKVRRGIETRYERGRWEKCLRTGWTPA